jgi:hypothetical protein
MNDRLNISLCPSLLFSRKIHNTEHLSKSIRQFTSACKRWNFPKEGPFKVTLYLSLAYFLSILVATALVLHLYSSRQWALSLYVLSETFKPLNAELNTICHSLILLGDLTFMGPCIVSIFQYISNKIQR